MDPSAPTLETTTLTARGVDDLLGYAGHALGTLPQRSLVLVTLAGARLRAVVRVDLPAADAPAPGWAGAVAAVCRRDEAATGTLALVLDPADAAAPPAWWPPLCAALAHAGLPVGEGWASADARAWAWPVPGGEGGSAACSGGGGAVSPQTSALSLHLLARGSVWGRRDRDLLVPPPAAGPSPPWHVPQPRDAAARAAWLAAWGAVLRGETAADLPGLGGPLVLPAWRDALVLQAACGPADPPVCAEERGRILTASSAAAPHWPGLDRLWEACRMLAACAPAPHAAQALAVAGWVSWARGHGSAAAAHLEAADQRDPGETFTAVLQRIVGAGLVAGWAASPDTAWRP